jgi:hypothetical protein
MSKEISLANQQPTETRLSGTIDQLELQQTIRKGGILEHSLILNEVPKLLM